MTHVRLVDTDVVSFVLKGDSRASTYARHLEGRGLCLSFVTVAELYRWTLQRKWGEKRTAELKERLRAFAVLPFDDAMAWEWARVMSMRGKPMAPGDGWVAATALRHGLPLVTHNRRHFEDVPGLEVISES